jgi:nicotinate-nucleotide pyrophosphorylase (carboxylating)
MTAAGDINGLSLPELFARLCEGGLVRRALELARDEDLGVGGYRGDITTLAWSGDGERAQVRLAARQEAVVSGLAAMPVLLELFAPSTAWTAVVSDGGRVERGGVVGTLEGPLREVLGLERTLLNLVSRLSGIATLTSWYVAEAGAGGKARICDTRKTTPGLRMLEKYAVRCGGGYSHRLGLYDAVLVKDNHIAAAREPGLLAARMIEASRIARADRPLMFVEAEADTLGQLDVFLGLPRGTLDVVLLDNMDTDTLREAVKRRDAAGSGLLLEASGGVNLRTVRSIAATGVDRISVGALTHSAQSVDFGLDAA